MVTGFGALALSASLALGYLALFYWLVARARVGGELTVREWSRSASERARLRLFFWANPIFFLALWGVASYGGWVRPEILPTPGQLLSSFWRLLSSGMLTGEAAISLKRVFIGFSGAAVIGVPLGLLAGSFISWRPLILPANSFLRYVPPTAFIALLIVYFGVGETYKYAVVFLGVIFFIVQMVVDVVDDVDSRHVDMALTSGLTRRMIFFRVIIPSCLPRVFDVLRINLSAAWTFLVAAELVGAERGLGHLVAVSQRFLRMDDLYTAILTFGVIGLLTDLVLESVSRTLFRWYYVSLRR